MAAALIAVSILFGKPSTAPPPPPLARAAMTRMWLGAGVSLGLIAMIFIGFKSGFATATEISAFASLYAIVVGSLMFRELSPAAAWRSFFMPPHVRAWCCSSSPPRNRWPLY